MSIFLFAAWHLAILALIEADAVGGTNELLTGMGNIEVLIEFKGSNATLPNRVEFVSEQLIRTQPADCHGRCMTCQRDPLLFPDSCNKCCSQYNWCGGGAAWCNWGTDCHACIASTTTSTTLLRQPADCPLRCTHCLRDHGIWRDACSACCSGANWCGKGAPWCNGGTDCSSCIRDLSPSTTTTTVLQQPSDCPQRCRSCRRDISFSTDSCSACCSRYNWCGSGTEWCGAGGTDCSACIADLNPGEMRLLEVTNSTMVEGLITNVKLLPVRFVNQTELLRPYMELLTRNFPLVFVNQTALPNPNVELLRRNLPSLEFTRFVATIGGALFGGGVVLLLLGLARKAYKSF